MGEIAHVDLDRLQTLAEQFGGIASEVSGLRWPQLADIDLPGSAVSRIVVGELVSRSVEALVSALDDWATAARAAAESFRTTDADNGQRFMPR